MIRKLLSRLSFALTHKTIRRIVVDPADGSKIYAHAAGATRHLKRRCPHQGGPLEKGYFQGNDLLCPWHGCRFRIAQSSKTK